MKNLIAFTGYKHSGKSTAATYVAEKLGATRLNFKDALVAEMKEKLSDVILFFCKLYDMTVDELFEKKPDGFRELMQNYGTDVCRANDPNYWVKKWMNSYAALHPEPVVVDDVRFINETEQIKSLQGIIIRIERSDIENGGTHSSETEMTQISPDYTITVGKGEHDKLYAELDKLV